MLVDREGVVVVESSSRRGRDDVRFVIVDQDDPPTWDERDFRASIRPT